MQFIFTQGGDRLGASGHMLPPTVVVDSIKRARM